MFEIALSPPLQEIFKLVDNVELPTQEDAVVNESQHEGSGRKVRKSVYHEPTKRMYWYYE